MTIEHQQSAPFSGFSDTLLADLPTPGTRYHLVVRIADVTPIPSDEGIAVADPPHMADDSILTILVPLGELDYFSVRELTDAAAGLVVGTYRSVTFDLSAVSFCDSSIGSFLDSVEGLGGGEIDVKVITSPAIERVLGLLAGVH